MSFEMMDLSPVQDRVSKAQVKDPKRVLDYAILLSRPLILGIMLSKFDAAVKEDTGALRKALQYQTIFMEKRGRLVWILRSGVAADVKKRCYALSSGAVRQPKVMRAMADLPSNNNNLKIKKAGLFGKRAKATLRKQVTGAARSSHRADVWRNGIINRARFIAIKYGNRGALETKTSYRVGLVADLPDGERGMHVSVIKPRRFFELDAAETARVMEAISQNLKTVLVEQKGG